MSAPSSRKIPSTVPHTAAMASPVEACGDRTTIGLPLPHVYKSSNSRFSALERRFDRDASFRQVAGLDDAENCHVGSDAKSQNRNGSKTLIVCENPQAIAKVTPPMSMDFSLSYTTAKAILIKRESARPGMQGYPLGRRLGARPEPGCGLYDEGAADERIVCEDG